MKDKYPYIEMAAKAENIAEQLRPHCVRLAIAGSIRRKCQLVGDIEIVCIPKPFETGLFSSGIATVIDSWQCVRGKLEKHCKYTQRLLPDGTKVDIFFTEPGNFGLQLAVRTGSAEYSHMVLAAGWVRAGYKSEGGYLWKDGLKYEVIEEVDLFKMIGVSWCQPEERNL